jgi:hypothetical protein
MDKEFDEKRILRNIKLNYNRKLREIMEAGKVLAAFGTGNTVRCAILTHDGYEELSKEFPDMAIMPLGKDCGLFKDSNGCIGFCNWANFIHERKGVFYLGKIIIRLPDNAKAEYEKINSKDGE